MNIKSDFYLKYVILHFNLIKNIMEFKNQYSKITFEDREIISENILPFHKKKIINYSKEVKYNTIKYSDMKSVKVFAYKTLSYIMYVSGLFSVVYGFSPKDREVLGTIYLDTPATENDIFMGCFFGVLLILLGYCFFNRKYGNTKSIIIKYFEGKIKSRQLFRKFNKDFISSIL